MTIDYISRQDHVHRWQTRGTAPVHLHHSNEAMSLQPRLPHYLSRQQGLIRTEERKETARDRLAYARQLL